jgi:hypothetical protein
MPIKLKNIPSSAKTVLDPFQEYITDILLPKKEIEKIDYAKRKLKAACHASELKKKIEKN